MSFLFSPCKEVATFKVIIWQTSFFFCAQQQEQIFTDCFFTFHFPSATGYAQMTSPIGKDKSPEFGSSSLSGVFNVDWIKKYAHFSYDFFFSLEPLKDHEQTQFCDIPINALKHRCHFNYAA